jgi:hypothetical protein
MKKQMELKKIIRKNRGVDEELLKESLASLRKLRRGRTHVRSGYNLMRPFSRRTRLAAGCSVGELDLRRR